MIFILPQDSSQISTGPDLLKNSIYYELSNYTVRKKGQISLPVPNRRTLFVGGLSPNIHRGCKHEPRKTDYVRRLTSGEAVSQLWIPTLVRASITLSVGRKSFSKIIYLNPGCLVSRPQPPCWRLRYSSERTGSPTILRKPGQSSRIM